MSMRKIIAALLLSCLIYACNTENDRLKHTAVSLCGYIPNPEHLSYSQNALTEDFYNAIDTMISLPDISPVLHQWEFFFVAADGSAIADSECEVASVTITDSTHAIATIIVQPIDSDYEKENHTLVLEKVNGKWLIDDFDDKKQACKKYMEIYRQNNP